MVNTLTKLSNIPVYHPDVEVFEVKDADGSPPGISMLTIILVPERAVVHG